MPVRKIFTSKDGATISYLEYSDATSNASKQRGLVILNGGLESGLSLTKLAEALSSDIRVYCPTGGAAGPAVLTVRPSRCRRKSKTSIPAMLHCFG